MSVPQILPTGKKDWTNRHDTFTQQIDGLFDGINGDTGQGHKLDDYNAMTSEIQRFIGKCITDKTPFRALGGGWSFTKIATSTGRMMDTKQMTFDFPVAETLLSLQYTGNKQQLIFAQCGNSVQQLHRKLNAKGKSLKTSGASNGQTIAGAISTGTHGSAFDFGATQDFIVGLHIIISPTKHIWLERESYPVTTDGFAAKLNAEPIRNDKLFNAALVSFGSFGFIHGVMIETEPLFLLECYRQHLPFDNQIKHLMNSLDFTNAPLPHGSERPFHFQALLNQYDTDNKVYLTTMYKRPYQPGYTPPVHDPAATGPGDDAPCFMGTLVDVAPALVPGIVNSLIRSSYPPYNNVWGTIGEIFTNTDTRGRVQSAAIGIPLSLTNQVTDLLLELNETDGPFSGVIAYRYVKQSNATLAFTQFPVTCVIELDGVHSNRTVNFYNKCWDALEASGIPFTFHWGKTNGLTPQRIKNVFGAKRDEWISERSKLLPWDSFQLFTNEQLTDWGLDEYLPPVVAPLIT